MAEPALLPLSSTQPSQLTAASQGAAESEGEGVLVVRFDGRSSVILHIEARYPVKLLHHINRHPLSASHPATHQSACVELPHLPSSLPPVVQMVGYGGGLLSTDRLSLTVRLMERSSLLLTSPAHSRAYKQPQPLQHGTVSGSELRHTFHVGPSSLLLFVPSPVSLFASSSLATASTVHLHTTASLLLLDVITGGRHTQGEQFGQSLYSATTTVYYNTDSRVAAVRDRVVLSEQQLDDAGMFGRYRARGTVLLLGPHLLPLALHLFIAHSQRNVRKVARGTGSTNLSTECVVSAAWVGGSAPEVGPAGCVLDSVAVERCLSDGRVRGGCLLRLLSVEVESLLRSVSRLLATLDSHMQGVAPWQRV